MEGPASASTRQSSEVLNVNVPDAAEVGPDEEEAVPLDL